MSIDTLLTEAVAAIKNEDSPLIQWFDGGRLRLIGPWQLREGDKWQAIAEPYNAYGDGFNTPIEVIGDTPEEALAAMLAAFRAREAQARSIA